MCKRKYERLNNLHKNLKVFPVGRKMCHHYYFHPIHTLTSPTESIIIQTSKTSCKCNFFYVILLSKHEKGLKCFYCNGSFRVILHKPFNNCIIKFMMILLKTLKYLKIYIFNSRLGMRILWGKIDLIIFNNHVETMRTWHNHQWRLKWPNYSTKIWIVRCWMMNIKGCKTTSIGYTGGKMITWMIVIKDIIMIRWFD